MCRYDTSVGWFNYSDEQVRENCKRAIEAGFTAMKLKVGSKDPERDIRRARIVREVAGPDARIMVDANQQWTLPQALDICARLKEINPFWIEEPTHPDDIIGHKTLADAIAPVKLTLGEHAPNRITFKNYLQVECAGFIQVDAVRVAGVSELLAVSIMCKKFGVPVVPHVGDMASSTSTSCSSTTSASTCPPSSSNTSLTSASTSSIRCVSRTAAIAPPAGHRGFL